MSFEATTHVWNNSPQKGTKLLMLLALANYANDDLEAWPSVATLAQRCRIHRRSVQKVLASLREAGEIEITGKARAGKNVYKLVFQTEYITAADLYAMQDGDTIYGVCDPHAPEGAPVKKDMALAGGDGHEHTKSSGTHAPTGTPVNNDIHAQGGRGGDALTGTKGRPHGHPNLLRTFIDKPLNIPFGENWENFKRIYPDRGGLPKDLDRARKMLSDLHEGGESLQLILSGLRAYAEAVKTTKPQDRKTIMTATNFLKRRTWEEYISAPGAEPSVSSDIDESIKEEWRDILESWPNHAVAMSWLWPLELTFKSDLAVTYKAPNDFHRQKIDIDLSSDLLKAWRKLSPDMNKITIIAGRRK